jgi:hypothetical protein
MTKSLHSTRNVKKKAMLSPKEKRMVKQAKKHSHDVQPLITPVITH